MSVGAQAVRLLFCGLGQVKKVVKQMDLEELVDGVLERFRTTSIMLHRPYPPTSSLALRSRLGGLPQLPEDVDWPMMERADGSTPLHFLAQIDCAEMPEIGSGLPTTGMLFFFADDADEQLWDDGEQGECYRVVYALEVPQDQPCRPAPDGLPPIRGESRYSGLPDLLPGEPGPSVHTAWPVIGLRMDSWPDYAAIAETQLLYGMVINAVNGDSADNKSEARSKVGEPVEFLEGYDEAEEIIEELEPIYDERVQACRLGALMKATSLPTHTGLTPNWGNTIVLDNGESQLIVPYDDRSGKAPFPQLNIMINRFARQVLRDVTQIKRHALYQEEDKQMALGQILDQGLYWVQQSSDHGLATSPSERDRERFMDWIGELSDRSLPLPLAGRLPDFFKKAMLSCIEYSVGSPEVADDIPPFVYNALENHHLPFTQMKKSVYATRSEWELTPRFHQMLGHVYSCQEAPSVEEEGVLLLQLYSDQGVHIDFGDAGSAQFWIKREDLLERRFDKAWAYVEGH